jgi:uncharacterized protein YecT (DUF1311 family)
MVLVLTVLSVNGLSAQELTSKAYAACMEKAAGATFAMQDCIADEHARQDKRLNSAYRALLASIAEKRKAALRDAQRKWIAFRDANCAFQGNAEDGQAGRLAANECLVTLTAQRAKELESLKTD